MGRLTKYYNGIAVINGMEFTEAAKKLAHYEDLEEQGRLIEVRCGEWTKRSNGKIWWYECSKCSGLILKNGWGNDMFSEFCPHCGANMVEFEGVKE